MKVCRQTKIDLEDRMPIATRHSDGTVSFHSYNDDMSERFCVVFRPQHITGVRKLLAELTADEPVEGQVAA